MTEPWRTTEAYQNHSRCLHALVIGTSHYTYLPQHPGESPPADAQETLGLGQATTPAASALAFARWLEKEYNNPEVPIGSVRLLVSPSQEEKDTHPELANPEATVLNSNKANVQAALISWRKDCEKNRDNVAVFYAAGHGVYISKNDSIVLLEDFGSPSDTILGCAMDVGAIWRGMSNKKVAKTQYYFVDACRIRHDVFSHFESIAAGVKLDVSGGGTPEVAPIYFSSTPYSYALGKPGEGTLFCQALLDCLKLHGVEGPTSDDRWTVTTTSLIKSLQKRVAALAAVYREEQNTIAGGMINEEVFHVLREPPEVPLHVFLDPLKAGKSARARLRDGLNETVIFDGVKFTLCPHNNKPAKTYELKRNVPGGTYVLSVMVKPGREHYKSRDTVPVAAFPPECNMEIPVK